MPGTISYNTYVSPVQSHGDSQDGYEETFDAGNTLHAPPLIASAHRFMRDMANILSTLVLRQSLFKIRTQIQT